MNFKLWQRIVGGLVFCTSTIVFLRTVAPTLSFWDCGEFITSAVTLGVPHPPGAPFFQLVGKIFSLLPFVSDLGLRVNLISTFSSSLTVLFTFLTISRLLRMWSGDPQTTMQALIILGAAAIGSLSLSFSDTFWFNASEAEVYGIGMFFISSVVWIALEWYARASYFKDERALLLIAYLMGLSIGIHLLSLLALFFVFFLIFLRGKEWRDINNLKSIFLFALASGAGFALVYPIVVKFVPQFLGTSIVSAIFCVLCILALIYVALMMKSYPKARLVAMSIIFVIMGYSTYILVVIRANERPALNENDPYNLSELYKYLNREQYGDYPLLKGWNYDNRTKSINTREKKYFPRRWSQEHVNAYAKYSSDLEYFLKFQSSHIYIRYFLWNFIGRAGDVQDAPVAFGSVDGDYSESQGYPNRYYAIPFVLGLIGLIFHFRKDWKTGISLFAFFLVCGVGLVVYFNMTEPQVRERDYFFIGSYYVFAIWIGIGVYAIYDYLREKFAGKNFETVGVALTAIFLVIGPLNMLKENYPTHDRALNYVAFDYAYNLLQSCDQDAILFTGGDNDTFPVWYLQYVAGVRRDIRVVNLSLVNTGWYSRQLKNEHPYGAKIVTLSYDDAGLEALRPVAWQKQTVSIPVDPGTIQSQILKETPGVNLPVNVPNKIEFTVEPTFTDPDGNRGIRVQDLMIIDIITNNVSKRPIYFALSTAQGDRIGLDDHLIVEGLAYRLTPYSLPRKTDRYYSWINTEVTSRHLIQQASAPDSNRSFGFLFRALNHPEVNLDEQSTRMVMSYRILFMGLAQVLNQLKNDKKTASDILAKMNETLPLEIHKMDPVLKTDLSYMYYAVDQKDKFLRMSTELEKFYLAELGKDITGRSSARDPYGVLLNIYQLSKQYQKAIDLLKRLRQVYPNEPGIDQQIAQFERLASGGTQTDTASKP